MEIGKFERFFIVRINRAIQDNESLSTWDLACEHFLCNGDEFEKKYKGSRLRFITAKTNLVNARLKRMRGEGLITIKKNSRKNKFILNNDRVVFKKYKFPDKKMRPSICIKDKENRWSVFQI